MLNCRIKADSYLFMSKNPVHSWFLASDPTDVPFVGELPDCGVFLVTHCKSGSGRTWDRTKMIWKLRGGLL